MSSLITEDIQMTVDRLNDYHTNRLAKNVEFLEYVNKALKGELVELRDFANDKVFKTVNFEVRYLVSSRIKEIESTLDKNDAEMNVGFAQLTDALNALNAQ